MSIYDTKIEPTIHCSGLTVTEQGCDAYAPLVPIVNAKGQSVLWRAPIGWVDTTDEHTGHGFAFCSEECLKRSIAYADRQLMAQEEEKKVTAVIKDGKFSLSITMPPDAAVAAHVLDIPVAEASIPSMGMGLGSFVRLANDVLRPHQLSGALPFSLPYDEEEEDDPDSEPACSWPATDPPSAACDDDDLPTDAAGQLK